MSSQAPEDAHLSLTGKRWRWPAAGEPSAAVPAGDAGRTEPAWLLEVLARRGVSGSDAVARYLAPSLASLDDPLRMADMAAAVDLLVGALRANRRIVVYGDYDVDGVCSTALLVETIRRLGGEADYYIPDRRHEGYGLNAAAVRELCGRADVLVTADCGITACDEVALARQLGSEVVVVDHHRVGAELPPASACLDPRRADCSFPFKDMCATGVAFMLAGALRRSLREAEWFTSRPEPDLRDALDLVALATVADVVPLRGLNRVFVASGLKRMAQRPRPGIAALCEVASVAPAALTSFDLGYRLGPRINARGRLSRAAEAVELMLTGDAARARLIAGLCDAANRERREIEKATVEAAVLRIARLAPEQRDGAAALVLHDPSWHPGVLGLVATRLVARYGRPAIVIGEGGKGSGRGIEGLDLHAAIAAAGAHLVRFGGHAAAAGITIAAEKVEAFTAAFTAAVREQLGPPPYVPELRPDLELAPQAVTSAMLPHIARLAPFGHQNPEPLWVSRGLAVSGARVVGGEHLKLTLDCGVPHEAIGFGMAALAAQLPARIDAAYRLERNTYGGQDRLQLKLEDVRPAS